MGELGLHLGEERRDRRRVDGVDVQVARPHLVELGPREEEADGAEEAGDRRHEDGPHAEILGEPGGVDRAGAAVGDQREVARVAPLLGRDRAQRARHPRVRDPVDPARRLEQRQPERLRDAARPPARRARRRS